MDVSDPIECSIFGVEKVASNSFFCRLIHTLWCAFSQTDTDDLLTCTFCWRRPLSRVQLLHIQNGWIGCLRKPLSKTWPKFFCWQPLSKLSLLLGLLRFNLAGTTQATPAKFESFVIISNNLILNFKKIIWLWCRQEGSADDYIRYLQQLDLTSIGPSSTLWSAGLCIDIYKNTLLKTHFGQKYTFGIGPSTN